MDDVAYIAGYELGLEAGRQEVIDYLDFKESTEWEACAVTIPWKEWQSKLKEWGIE